MHEDVLSYSMTDIDHRGKEKRIGNDKGIELARTLVPYGF